MGIVIRQSSISTVFTYLGAVIGYVNVLWLFPSFLSTEQIGLLRIIPSVAFLLLPLAQMGLPQSLMKFYPELKDKEHGIPQLLGLLVVGLFVGIALFGIAIWILNQPIITYFSKNSALLIDYFHVVICLVILFSFQALFDVYARTLYKIIAINFIKEVLIRLLTSLAVSLYFLNYISFVLLANGLIVIYSIALGALVLYLFFLKKLKISFRFTLIDRKLFKRILNYGFYALLGSGGGYVLLHVDQVMISSMLGLSENGVYTTAFYIAVVIEMVRRPIAQITMPFISESFRKNDIGTIERIYKQVSINQMIIGSLLFIGIVCNLDSLYLLMPNSEAFMIGKWVVILVGLGKLIDMTFGINGEVIVMSDYYKFNMVTVILLAVFTVLSNHFLIPAHGINGAALATLLSVTFYNLIKMTFIYVKFNIIPFTYKNLIAVGIVFMTFAVGYYFPRLDNIIFDMIVRSAVITIVFALLIYFLKVSEEVNGIVIKIINKRLKT